MRKRLPAYTNTEIKRIICEKIHSKRDRNILYMKLVDGRTFLEVAEQMNMPVSTVTDAYYKQLKILFSDFPG